MKKRKCCDSAELLVQSAQRNQLLRRRLEEYEKALMKIAAYEDVEASNHLYSHGSWAFFDEPAAAKVAREVLKREKP